MLVSSSPSSMVRFALGDENTVPTIHHGQHQVFATFFVNFSTWYQCNRSMCLSHWQQRDTMACPPHPNFVSCIGCGSHTKWHHIYHRLQCLRHVDMLAFKSAKRARRWHFFWVFPDWKKWEWSFAGNSCVAKLIAPRINHPMFGDWDMPWWPRRLNPHGNLPAIVTEKLSSNINIALSESQSHAGLYYGDQKALSRR